MADSRPARGHPRRPEGIKRLKLRESTYNLWIERKEALGLQGISNTGNYFAEILLHQELTRDRDRSPHAHPDDTSLQVHQGKILKIVFKKTFFLSCHHSSSNISVSVLFIHCALFRICW